MISEVWIYGSDFFLSIVADKHDPKRLVVRARHAGDIERLFPAVQVLHTTNSDYAYRASIKRCQVATVIAKQLVKTSYTNFKDTVTDIDRHDAYMACWSRMVEWQGEGIYYRPRKVRYWDMERYIPTKEGAETMHRLATPTVTAGPKEPKHQVDAGPKPEIPASRQATFRMLDTGNHNHVWAFSDGAWHAATVFRVGEERAGVSFEVTDGKRVKKVSKWMSYDFIALRALKREGKDRPDLLIAENKPAENKDKSEAILGPGASA